MQLASKLFLLLFLFQFSTNLAARSPAVLPGVEIEPEREIQEDMNKAKGHSFDDFTPTYLEQRQQSLKKNSDSNSRFNGFTFLLALTIPGIVSMLLMRKAHKVPQISDGPEINSEENKSSDTISKAS